MIKEYIGRIWRRPFQKLVLRHYKRTGPRFYTASELRNYIETYRNNQENGSRTCKKCHDYLICTDIVRKVDSGEIEITDDIKGFVI